MTDELDLSDQFVDDYRKLEQELERLRSQRDQPLPGSQGDRGLEQSATDGEALVGVRRKLDECRARIGRLQEQLRGEKRLRRAAERALTAAQSPSPPADDR